MGADSEAFKFASRGSAFSRLDWPTHEQLMAAHRARSQALWDFVRAVWRKRSSSIVAQSPMAAEPHEAAD